MPRPPAQTAVGMGGLLGGGLRSVSHAVEPLQGVAGHEGVGDSSGDHVPRGTIRVSGWYAVAAIITSSRLHGRVRNLK
jgi:hypothetical protein